MNCYFYKKETKHDLPSESNYYNTKYYIENHMTLKHQVDMERPNEHHMVTDSHCLLSLYKKEELFLLKGRKWVNPYIKTFWIII